ncbi:MAG: CSLREA domain-containing protein, partial [Gammaproteobacteria bacterium]|nr:CSLREA domain-containing protein [Gammaproteobacteria bacterium]
MQRLLPFPRIAVGACALFMLGGTAQGSEFTVTKTNDTASTCDDGDCSLREAIIAANANGTADIINLTTGTYTLTIAGTPEEGALTGDLDITENLDTGDPDLTINGNGAVIDGGEMNRVFDIHQGTVTFNGLTIQ